MKNIFDYATKELSQDAFLLWLVNCCDDENKKLSEFAKKFLIDIVGADKDSQVKNVKTIAQNKKLSNVDIFIEFEINNKKIAVALEDKVNTGEHDNQLFKIAKAISNEKKYDNYYLIYYKTGFVTRKEERDLKEINKSLKEDKIIQQWKIFNINSIKQFFDKNCKDINNLLVDSYYEHVNKLAQSYVIMDEDIINEELLEWQTKKARWTALFDEFDTELPNDSGVGYYVSYWYKYIRINDDKKFFSIELRSCSLKQKKASFHLVMYSMPKEYQTEKNFEYFQNLCSKNNKIILKKGTKKQVGLVECKDITTVKDYKKAVQEVVEICKEVYKYFDVSKLNTCK